MSELVRVINDNALLTKRDLNMAPVLETRHLGIDFGGLKAVDDFNMLLDEPAAGMNPSETAELMENIRKIRDTFHIAIMLIEHDMNLVMGICEGIAVLNYGKIIAKGTPEEIKNNSTVIEAYLGKQAED